MNSENALPPSAHNQSIAAMSQSMPAPPAGYAHAPPPTAHHHQQPHPGQPQAVPQHGYQPAPQHHQGHHLPPPPHQPQHGHAYPPHPHGQHLPPPPASAMLHSAHQPPPQPLPPTQMTRPEVSIQRGDNIVQTLMPLSLTDEKTNRKFSLDVAQQPIRARMCGFGDKDRRPITPPPCVRLIITDLTTGKEIDPNEIEHSLFVLNVDLWNEDGSREFNLVRSSTGSPSISSTTPFSYSALNGGGDATQSQYNTQMMPSNRDQTSYGQTGGVGYVQDYQMQQGFAPVATNYPQGGTSYGPAQQYYPHQNYRPEGGITSLPSQSMAPYSRNGMPPGYGPDETAMSRAIGQPVDQRGGMFTRNLIGSLAASAFKLSDTNDRLGIWFILQDLSVRTEGAFRLRFSFVNVGAAGGIKAKDDVAAKLNTGRAPILASCFSEVFNVYSAKKFPGVCESTPLSKTFATQGIKIPIRKDTNVRGGGDDDDVYD